MGDSYILDLEGIVVGHLYYFFKVRNMRKYNILYHGLRYAIPLCFAVSQELYPRTSGRHFLATPDWLKRKCADWGLGRPPVVGPDTAAAARDPGFRAFRGQGQRLGM